MAESENHERVFFRESGRVLPKRLTIRLPISIKHCCAVLRVHHQQMQHVIGRGLFRGARKILGATEAIAAGNPVAIYSLANNDRVESPGP